MGSLAPPGRQEPIIIGADGVATLALSTLLMLVSLGSTLLYSIGYVLWTAWRTECDAPPCQSILVLGMRLGPCGRPTPEYSARLARASVLWSKTKSARIIILGGTTVPGLPSEAECGAISLKALGVPTDCILVENQSRHTLENLRRYRTNLAEQTVAPVAVVTSRFHLARSSLLATGLNIRHIRVAAEDRRCPPIRHFPLILFEAVLVHWYITGRTFARLTRNRRMMARIS